MHIVSMSLVALLYIFLGVVVPLKKLSTNIKQNNKLVDKPNKYILLSFLRIFVYTIAYVVMMIIFFESYNIELPSTSSDACTNYGGWVYSCLIDWKSVIVPLIAMFVTTIIHYFLCEIEIHNIFRKTNVKLRYVAVVCYLLIMVAFNFCLIFMLYGLLISTYFDSLLAEIFRGIVALLPMIIFAISTYLRCLIKKLTNK